MHPHDELSQGSLMDRFVADFQMLRLSAGDVSYAQIAERVRRLRADRGANEAEAYVGRSTIYDAFRAGRRRINPALVADIATVLGEGADRAAYWRDYCVRARAEEVPPASPAPPVPPAASAPPAVSTALSVPEAREAAPEVPAEPVAAVPSHPGSAVTAEPASAPRAGAPSFVLASALVVAMGVLVNMAGSFFVRAVGLPLYLDMVGTAIVSVALGPWYGVAVAILTHGLLAVIEATTVGLPFTLVNVTGALVWGYGVRSWRMGTSPSRVLILSALAGVCCSLVAALLILFVYGGLSINAGADALSGNLMAVGHQLWGAVLSANMITSLMDKLISGFIALAALPLLLRHLVGGRRRHAVDGIGSLFSGLTDASGGPGLRPMRAP